MNFGSPWLLAIAALGSAIALGSCRTSSREDTTALARLSPVSTAVANEPESAMPALTLALATPDAANAYRRAVAHAALSYEFEQQSCKSLATSTRGACLESAFQHFADARASAHAARMAALAAH